MKNKSRKKFDAALFDAFGNIPTLSFYGRVRQDETELARQKQTFFKTDKPPLFSYPKAQAFDVKAYFDVLDEVENQLEQKSDSVILIDLYRAKIKELRTRAQIIEAVQNKSDHRITDLSRALFGDMAQGTEELEAEFQEMIKHPEEFHKHERPVTAEPFARMVRQTLDHYAITGWDVERHLKPSIKINHIRPSQLPVIRVPKDLKITKARAARLLTHEIEVHVLRTDNGDKSPLHLLSRGLDRYLATDEGLAVYFQQQLTKDEHRHAPGFWDAWTTALTQEGDFKDTFIKISQARTELAAKLNDPDPAAKGRDAAWRLSIRAYRGITDTSQPGVGFLRDHIYRSGNRLINEAVSKQGLDVLPVLFCGNIGLHHLDAINKLNIPPGRTPELVSKEVVREVMKIK
ncbi:DUF1704 domain-containing protein [Patescibacteria group bacterium]|nr:DUF1704 domain-containing protein [Patescibacteria group bacterium]